jgi:hypothetical protein
MRGLFCITIVVTSLFLLTQCNKKDCGCVPPPNPGVSNLKLGYGDSVFYLKNTDYTIAPLNGKTGTYTAFPDNLIIDRTTGAITVKLKGVDGESQTGMKYRITYKSNITNEVDSTFILLSGITYVDKFYYLSQNDSIIYPIYNGDPAKAIPSGNYDLDNDNKLAINPSNGQINIKESMRRGFLGSQFNTSWKIASIEYAVNDNSKSVTNEIDIVIYYYHTLSDVPSNVSALMQAHQQLTVGMRTAPIPSTTGAIDNNLPSNLSLFKPRPPCVIIVGN